MVQWNETCVVVGNEQRTPSVCHARNPGVRETSTYVVSEMFGLAQTCPCFDPFVESCEHAEQFHIRQLTRCNISFWRRVLGPGCGYFLYLHQSVRCSGLRLNRLRGKTYLNSVMQRSPKRQPEKLYKILNMKQPVITLCSWTAKLKVTCFGISWCQLFEQNAVVCCILAFARSISTPDRIQPVVPRDRFRISNWRCYIINSIHQIWQPASFTPFRP